MSTLQTFVATFLVFVLMSLSFLIGTQQRSTMADSPAWQALVEGYTGDLNCGTDTDCAMIEDIYVCLHNRECADLMWAAAVDYEGELDVPTIRAMLACQADPNLILWRGVYCEDVLDYGKLINTMP